VQRFPPYRCASRGSAKPFDDCRHSHQTRHGRESGHPRLLTAAFPTPEAPGQKFFAELFCKKATAFFVLKKAWMAAFAAMTGSQ
jgi:hypothetical protein